MAISKNFDFRGITVTKAYVRFTHHVLTSKTTARAYWGVWASKSDSDLKPMLPIEQGCVDFTLNPDSPLHVQAYAALKQLPGFSGSTDV